MKKTLIILTIGILGILAQPAMAQQADVNSPNIYRDSVVQLFGVIMTADSLKAIPFASVVVNNKGRGTVTNYDGVFSIAVNKGEKITFTCVGFKDRTINVLVATDIASRGIDVDKLTHVINYEIPEQAEAYVHRIGRTGRAGESGEAISLCSHEELPYFKGIQKLIKKDIDVVKKHPYS